MTLDTLVHLTQQDRARLRELISEYSGLDQSIQTDDALEQAVARRLAARRLGSLAEYWPLIQRDPAGYVEMNSLVQLLTNKETFLFREMHHFEVLRDWVLPDLLATSGQPLRLWSAGCATGEEPYSLAITLLEYQARHGEFEAEVIATDIDANALEKARQGCYGERSLRLVPDDLRQRYFSFDGRVYCIIPKVARLVTFRAHNLAQGRSSPALVDLDVIFCRNVTIYFDDKARDRLNAQLADSLREGGYLFVASAETMGHNRGRLELVSMGETFLFRKGQPADQRAVAAAETAHPTVFPAQLKARHQEQPQGGHAGAGVQASVRSAVPARGTEPEPVPSLLQRAFKAFQQQDYDSALRELDRLPADQPLPPQAHCLRGAILLQQERLVEAQATCQRLLARDPWYSDAHFLLGLIHRHLGQADEAIQALKQAIYLQPSHRDAHFYLAETYRAVGLVAEAAREYENTLNTLRVAHLPGVSPTPSLTGLEDGILRQACEVNLRKLRGRP